MSPYNFDAIGTNWQIDINDIISPEKFITLKSEIHQVIDRFDLIYSRFKETSWVYKNAYKKGLSQKPKYFDELFALYKDLYKLSDGLFTPLIGSVMEQAGYDKNYSLKSRRLSSPPPLDLAITEDSTSIQFNEEVLLDFGAAGKGYLVDLVAQLFLQKKIYNFCVDASGDILHKSLNEKPIRVGLENPNDSSQAIGVCELLNKSICASSGSRRKWGSFHHTINPLTLTSPESVVATWVVADHGIIADGLATSLFLDPVPQKYIEHFRFDCVILYKDNSAFISENFPGELFK